MGEVGASRDDNLGLEMFQEADLGRMNNVVGASGGIIRWERFLPCVVLRVLLVEADDSTRQIITALLKKCGYRVAAVSDGLKAWEVLRANADSIDLILTEVELPSISGFALLSLSMEHEMSKNIPVIMMSSNDSISTVYNCMLKGAADFLVKPIRRNELKNLWQHVWRKHTQSNLSKSFPQDENVTPEKVEATAENNSNHTSGYKACELISKDKGSGDSQSSCTKPVIEGESTYMENVQDLSLLKWSGSTMSDPGLENHEETVKPGQEFLKQETETGGQASIKMARGVCWNTTVEPDSIREDPNNTNKACDDNNLPLESSKSVIDLIASFDTNPEFSCQNPDSNIVHNFCSTPQLDLSLRRSHFYVSKDQATDEKQTINHSNASAFAPYINKTLQLSKPIPSSFCREEKESEKNTQTHNTDPSVPALIAQNNSPFSKPAFPPVESEATTHPCPQEQAAPASGMRFDNAFAGRPPLFHAQSGPSSASVNETSCGSKQHEPAVHNVGSPKDQKRESLDGQGHLVCSGATDLETADAVLYSNNGSNGDGRAINATSHQVLRSGSDCGNLEGSSTHDASQNVHRSSLREAALNKFRLKRKDRCFEKKVRYESRKKLAEQRPRVKGQFVRQVQNQDEYC